jgi:hypothetical protein
MKLVHPEKAGEVDTREKVSSGNTDLFCGCMQALLGRAYVGTTAHKISRCSRIDAFRKVGQSASHFKLRDESIWGEPA